MSKTRKGGKSNVNSSPAGSLPAVNNDLGPIVSPEGQATISRGVVLSGPITRRQKELLVRRGYGEREVGRWTQQHADEVLSSGNCRRLSEIPKKS